MASRSARFVAQILWLRSLHDASPHDIKLIYSRNFRISASREINLEHSPERRKTLRKFPVLLCGWLAFIFGTSCTVIRPNEFFSLVARFTGADPESMKRFALFWGVSWFAIVKGWHFAEFFILTFLVVAALKWCCGMLTRWSIFGAMLFCIAFAAFDEWHQSFVPDRFGTVQDVLIDSLGVCVAGSILLLQLNRRTQTTTH